MKNKLKYIILFFLVLILFTGCTATDTVTLTDDGVISEQVVVMESNDKVLYGNKTLEDSVKQYLSEYESAFNLRKYKTEVKVEDEISGAVITNEYDDVCAFINKTIFSQYLYNHINCRVDGEYYIIESVGDFITHESRYISDPAPDVMNFKLKLPFSLDEHNADLVEENTYTWTYDRSSSADKILNFKINKAKVDKIKEEAINRKIHEQRVKLVVKICAIVASLVLIIVLGLLTYKKLSTKMKENKIDYE